MGESMGQRRPVVAVVQARMTSTRLPGKVLMEICGKPAMQLMLERVARVRRVDSVVVATTVNAEDDPVVELCERVDVSVYRGDENDVLGRFVGAAGMEGAAAVLRLTADCPMIDPDVVDDILAEFESGEWDYVSNCNERTFPDGLDAEVFTYDALLRADREAKSPFLREHVTPYIRGSHPQEGDGNFRCGQVKFEADFSHVRWTLDTDEDLLRIRELLCALPDGYGWLDALSLATRRPRLLGLDGGD